MDRTHDFRLVTQDELVFHCTGGLIGMYKLSPCVWQENGRYDLLLRVVNHAKVPSDKVARIHYGTSNDGIEFTLEEAAVIAPDPDPNAFDNGGCEDPTVAYVDGTYNVYYSGWNGHFGRGELLLASGPDIHHLKKRGIALPSSAHIANPKEATIVRAPGGTWRLFFEYAHEGKSKVGLAASQSVRGPWEIREPLFDARPQTWDSWHLSTGPILDSNPAVSGDVLQRREPGCTLAHRLGRVQCRLHACDRTLDGSPRARAR